MSKADRSKTVQINSSVYAFLRIRMLDVNKRTKEKSKGNKSPSLGRSKHTERKTINLMKMLEKDWQ
jgi:hypothetical protein